MAYAIRSKGRFHVMRDVADPRQPKPEEPIYEVGPREWVGFENLPGSTSESGDADLDVEAVDLGPNGEWPDWVTRPESVQAKRARLKAEAMGGQPEPAPLPVVKSRRKAKLSDNSKPEKKDDEE